MSERYRPELDGLRGISILLVYLHHLYPPIAPGGFLGVDIFFVLSGFLITSLLAEEWSQKNSISLKNFYVRRGLRLMPAVLLLIFILGVLITLVDKKTGTQIYHGIWLTLSYVSNWFYATKHFTLDNPLSITWSLAIEEQFYLTWPLLLTLALRLRLKRRWIILGLAFVVATIPVHRRILMEQGANAFRLYYGSDTRADGLSVGCLVGLLTSWSLLPHNKAFGVCIKILAITSVIFLGYLVSYPPWADMFLLGFGGFTLVALSVAICLIMVILWPPKFAVAILRYKPLVWVGRISYGLYLWHWVVYWFIYRKKIFSVPLEQLALMLALSFALPALSFHLVEKPFLRLKKRFGSMVA